MSAWWILAGIIGFSVVILGLFLFPNLHSVVIGIDTSQGGYIENGIHTLIPYAFLGAIGIGIWTILKGRSGGGGI